MKKLVILVVVFMFSIGFSVVAYSQTAQERGEVRDQRGVTTERGVPDRGTPERGDVRSRDMDKYQTLSKDSTFKAGDLIGLKVENTQGEDLGKISDMAIDPQDNRVAFAVLAHGGTFGMGEKYTAIPLSALTLKGDKDSKPKMFVLNMDKERLAQAPTFDKNSWPDKKTAEESYRYFGQHPYWNTGAPKKGEAPSSMEQDRSMGKAGHQSSNGKNKTQ